MVRLGASQARADQFDVVSRSLAALPRFLLKGVEHVDNAGKTDGVDGPVGVAIEVIYDLQNATGGGAASGSGSSGATAQASTNGSSFRDKLASKIAEDLLAKYQQAGGPAGTFAQSSKGNQVNAIA